MVYILLLGVILTVVTPDISVNETDDTEVVEVCVNMQNTGGGLERNVELLVGSLFEVPGVR